MGLAITIKFRRSCVVAVIAMFAAGVAWAQEPARLKIATDPPGADIAVDGMPIGLSPAAVTLPVPESGRWKVSIRMPGYADAARDVAATGAQTEVRIALIPARGRIVVTSPSDRALAYDGFITLREALLYAKGARVPLGADTPHIDGQVGKGHADDIVFDPTVFAAPRFLFTKNKLPPLDDPGDRLLGPAQQFTIMPSTDSVQLGTGIIAGPGVAMENLVIDGFDTGISASGFGKVEVSNIRVLGAKIAIRASDGTQVLADGVGAAVDIAPRVAANGGIIDGRLEPIPVDKEQRAVLRVDRPGWRAYWRVVGAIPIGDQPRDCSSAMPKPPRYPRSRT